MHRLEAPPSRIGDDVVGHAIDAPLSHDRTWDICRIADLALAQSAWRLIESVACFGPMPEGDIPMAAQA